jgi:hypothetical protein
MYSLPAASARRSAQTAAMTASSTTIPRMEPSSTLLSGPSLVSVADRVHSFDSASLEILRKLSELAEGQNELISLLRSITTNHVQSPPQFSPPAHNPLSAPLAATPGSNAGPRRDIETLPSTSPSDYADASYSRLDRLVQASIGSSALPLRDTRETLGAFAQNQLSPQEYFEVGSDAAAAQGNPAALRWFDLLANDAGRDSLPPPQAHSEIDQGRSFSQGRDGTEVTPLQRATRIIDDDVQPNGAQESYEQMGDVSENGPSKWLLERRLWQAESDIQLLPREQILFDKFVHQISSAVCCSRDTSLWLLRLTRIQLDLFDPRRTFSAVVSRQAVCLII